MTSQHRLHVAPGRPGPYGARILIGILIVVVGVGWFLDGLDVVVPWRALPAAGLVMVGAVIAVSGRARGSLVALGAVLLSASLLVALPVRGYAGPIGDRTVAPSPVGWPVVRTLGAGLLRVDLTRRALPAGGRVKVRVGVGDLRLFVPAGVSVWFSCGVAVGTVTVDGLTVDDGFDAGWSQGAADPDAVLVDARVGIGSLEVRRE